MYFCFYLGDKDLDSLKILAFSTIPMLQSSNSAPTGSIFGFLATSSK